MKVKINNFSGGLRLDRSENLTGLEYARVLENFEVDDGSLSVHSGLRAFAVENGVSESILAAIDGLDLRGGKVFVFNKFDFNENAFHDRVLVFDSAHKGYYFSLSGEDFELKELGISFTSAPVAINYRLNGEDVVILVSETDQMVVWDGVLEPEIILDAPKIKSMDIHYERLFAVTGGGDDTELKFSDDLDPTNWSESLSDAGFISMVDERGRLLKVISFNDYLYVFREHGITRVYANTALQTMFYVNHLFTAGGRILGDTLALVGGQVLFLATDGFYLFDGADTRKCLEQVFSGIKVTGRESAAYFNGKYYLACHIGRDEGLENNAILVVKLSNFCVSVIKYGNPESLCVLRSGGKTKLLVLSSAGSPKLLEIGEEQESSCAIGLPAVFESEYSDFNEPTENKVLRRVRLKLSNPASREVVLKIENEDHEYVEFSTTGEMLEELSLFSGHKFRYHLSTTGPDVKILALHLEISG